MNNYKFFISIFMLLVFLATRTSIAYAAPSVSILPDAGFVEAEEEDGDYTVIRVGEEAPYDGFLFDSDGLIKVMTNKSFELDKLKLEKDFEIQKLHIEINTLKKQQEIELRINKDLTESIIKIKDNRIQQLEDSKRWDDAKLFGSMLLGMALSVTIFYAAVKITK